MSRREAYGWAALTGIALGLCAAACQQAATDGHDRWGMLFAVQAVAAGPAYFATCWPALRR